MKLRLFVLVLIAIVTLPLLGQQATRNTDISAIQDNMTYGELSAKWFQWAFSLPSKHHPLWDTADCSTGQSGPVWFLGGKFCTTEGNCNGVPVTRSCAIPKNKALFFPVINSDYSFIENDISWSEDDMRTHVKQDMDTPMTLTATLDGRRLQLIRICTMGDKCLPVQSPLTPFILPGDNMIGAIPEYLYNNISNGPIPDGASSVMVTDGHYVLIPQISPGFHTIHFTANVPAWGFGLDITYNLLVLK